MQQHDAPQRLGPLQDNFKNSRLRGVHDYIEEEIVSATRPARVQYADFKAIVPTHACSKYREDVLVTVLPANLADLFSFVVDFSMHNPYTGLLKYKRIALQEDYKSTINIDGQAYWYMNSEITIFSLPQDPLWTSAEKCISDADFCRKGSDAVSCRKQRPS